MDSQVPMVVHPAAQIMDGVMGVVFLLAHYLGRVHLVLQDHKLKWRTYNDCTRLTIILNEEPGLTNCWPSWRTVGLPSVSAPPSARTLSTSTGFTCTPRTEEASWSAQIKRPGRTSLLSLGLGHLPVEPILSKSIMERIYYHLNVILREVV